ncbi:hypothetical protein KXX26_008940 [Aspergillus fumigatus]|nr:hypothetical protein KXX26_008940 [Aspergillus fumigatus]
MPGLPGRFDFVRLVFTLLQEAYHLTASIDLDECIERLYRKELLADTVIEAICAKAKELLMKESNVVHIRAPVTVVGDIHGQFFDMIEIFKIGGFCPNTNYLFLGDYVDRGLFSVETISLLVCLKLRYPQRVHLIRGNHESRGVTQSYGFYTECARKYGNANVWHYFTDMFDFLTLSVVINDQIFCVHGGLSPSIHSIDQIKIIDRFREIPHEGPMADLVWSDPDTERDEFSLSPRGAGYTFGAQVVRKFLEVNSIVLEVSDTGERYFNIFDAAPENEIHRGEQQAQQNKDGQSPVIDYFL